MELELAEGCKLWAARF